MSKVVQIECPDCHASIWVDLETQTIVQHKKQKKKKTASFDSLLLKEKEKKEKAEVRFKAASELEKEKKRRAQDLFEKSIKDTK